MPARDGQNSQKFSSDANLQKKMWRAKDKTVGNSILFSIIELIRRLILPSVDAASTPALTPIDSPTNLDADADQRPAPASRPPYPPGRSKVQSRRKTCRRWRQSTNWTRRKSPRWSPACGPNTSTGPSRPARRSASSSPTAATTRIPSPTRRLARKKKRSKSRRRSLLWTRSRTHRGNISTTTTKTSHTTRRPASAPRYGSR